jgi:hypothetical protein
MCSLEARQAQKGVGWGESTKSAQTRKEKYSCHLGPTNTMSLHHGDLDQWFSRRKHIAPREPSTVSGDGLGVPAGSGTTRHRGWRLGTLKHPTISFWPHTTEDPAPPQQCSGTAWLDASVLPYSHSSRKPSSSITPQAESLLLRPPHTHTPKLGMRTKMQAILSKSMAFRVPSIERYSWYHVQRKQSHSRKSGRHCFGKLWVWARVLL